MSAITTHVLDTSRGRPASGVPIVLERAVAHNEWREIGRGVTDNDGRLRTLLADSVALEEGAHRLRFDTASYFTARSVESFYPEVIVVFSVKNASEHYHVPLLLNPFGYSTYRGS